MIQYLNLMRHIRDTGVDRGDRTGTGTRSVFGYQMRFDLIDGFPLVTTKKINFKAVVAELLWMLSGDTNVKTLQDQGVHIWDQWATEDGSLGPIYGEQWRQKRKPCSARDPMGDLLRNLKERPESRRHVISSWNYCDLPFESWSPQKNALAGRMALAPCHCLFQFYVANGKLSCQLYQRSADVMIGVPFNIASYALLTHMIAQVVGLEVGEYIHTFGDAHLYLNHMEQVDKQLSREPRPLPRIELNPEIDSLFAFTADDIALLGYDPHPWIEAQVAV